MNRLSVCCGFLAASMASAQDMPLSEIIKAGETWTAHAGEMLALATGGYRVDAKNRMIILDRVMNSPGKPIKHAVKEPTACVVALGGSHLLIADSADRHVWAFRIEQNGTLGPGDRYCRLRVQGDERRKVFTAPEKFRADPSAMTIDSANRTYVATSLGIQVFDPTGRMCGVFTGPPGRVVELTFAGNQLFARTDGKIFVRTMRADGGK